MIVGLDIGTSSVKGIALNEDGAIVARAESAYRLSTPRPGWAEQDPEDWWRAVQEVLDALPPATGIGLFLPPIGVGFFIACGIAKVPVDRASGAMLPYVWMMCIGLLVVILFPWFTLVVPRILKLV